MKKNVLIITEAGPALADTIRDLLESPRVKVFVAIDEKDAIHHLKKIPIEFVVMNPIMSSNVLVDGSVTIKNPERGGVGYLLVSNLKKLSNQFKDQNPQIVLRTTLSSEDIQSEGFEEPFLFFSTQTSSWTDIADVISAN